jgi:hypothetical protein
MVHKFRLLNKQNDTYNPPSNTPIHQGSQMHARKRAHTHNHIHNTYCFSRHILRERASMLRNTYTASLVHYKRKTSVFFNIDNTNITHIQYP